VDEPNYYPEVADNFTRILRTVTDEQWDLPTPCEDWSVRDLVTHVVATHQRVYSLLGTEPAALEEPPAAAWDRAHQMMLDALEDPALAATPVHTRAGEQDFSALVGGLVMFDTLCHSWDLARAVGADETLCAPAVARAHARLAEIDDAIRVPGGFGPAVTPEPDADAQTRFLNFVGRRP
jgi:uncharacterized protein (TIGR03086 family)